MYRSQYKLQPVSFQFFFLFDLSWCIVQLFLTSFVLTTNFFFKLLLFRLDGVLNTHCCCQDLTCHTFIMLLCDLLKNFKKIIYSSCLLQCLLYNVPLHGLAHLYCSIEMKQWLQILVPHQMLVILIRWNLYIITP